MILICSEAQMPRISNNQMNYLNDDMIFDPKYSDGLLIEMGIRFNGYQVYMLCNPIRGYIFFWVVDNNIVKLMLSGKIIEHNTIKIKYVASQNNNDIPAQEFYYYLLDYYKMTLISDKTQSKGGYKIWQKLSDNPNINMKHINENNEEIKLYRGIAYNLNYKEENRNTRFKAVIK